jgi:hypothetical protein
MGQFDLTPTGRIKRDSAGWCNYEIPIPTLPSAVRAYSRNNPFPKSYVAVYDGTDCPLWAPKARK